MIRNQIYCHEEGKEKSSNLMSVEDLFKEGSAKAGRCSTDYIRNAPLSRPLIRDKWQSMIVFIFLELLFVPLYLCIGVV